MNWIKKDDKVYVLTGNDKGKTGTVIGIKEDRVLVQGVNVRKKHIKKSQKSQASQVLSIEMPIHISNVALCDKEGKKIKKINVTRNDKKNRDLTYFDGEKEIVHRTIKKREK
jgi:large subunit ribosomal protein L24